MAGLLAAGLAGAYESDQLTGRGEPLGDATAAADARMDGVLAGAIAEVTAHLGCPGPTPDARRALARAIHTRTARRTLVPDRGPIAQYGFGAYSAWLETAPEVPRRDTRGQAHVLSQVRARDSFVLHHAGLCSTFSIAGVRTGSDKLDHFLDTGWRYWSRSHLGADVGGAVAWATWNEATWVGLYTSKTFSYADLLANWQGYRFYAGLLGYGSVVQADPDGCLVQSRPWSWAEWISPGWDEVINPPVYTRAIQRRVDLFLDAQGEALCAGLDGEALPPLPTHGPWVGRRAPPQGDPYDLEARCGVRR